MAYYLHWDREDILNLEHKERIRFCEEVSKINAKMNSAGGEEKKNIFDIT
ncbi:MAG: hypothetical protein Q4B14_06745 [Clostridia bacterium]|nr:hypothetical protein [Clostridia bacterium]